MEDASARGEHRARLIREDEPARVTKTPRAQDRQQRIEETREPQVEQHQTVAEDLMKVELEEVLTRVPAFLGVALVTEVSPATIRIGRPARSSEPLRWAAARSKSSELR